VSVTDYQTAPNCGYCGEKISISDDNAGHYAMRKDEQMHKRCAELWDGEQVKECRDCPATFTGSGVLCKWCWMADKL
jgi:hypothetical protein